MKRIPSALVLWLAVSVAALCCGESFPTNGVMPAGWTLTPAASTGWSVSSVYASEGTNSLKANAIPNSGIAGIQYSGFFYPGKVTFAGKVSSETNNDALVFTVVSRTISLVLDSNNQVTKATNFTDVATVSQSGEQSWQTNSFDLPAGYYDFRWEYKKNSSGSAGQDSAWIDAVVLPPEVPTNELVRLLALGDSFMVYGGMFEQACGYINNQPELFHKYYQLEWKWQEIETLRSWGVGSNLMAHYHYDMLAVMTYFDRPYNTNLVYFMQIALSNKMQTAYYVDWQNHEIPLAQCNLQNQQGGQSAMAFNSLLMPVERLFTELNCISTNPPFSPYLGIRYDGAYDSHGSGYGHYMASCMLYACLTGQSPVGLPLNVDFDQYGNMTYTTNGPRPEINTNWLVYGQNEAWTIWQRERELRNNRRVSLVDPYLSFSLDPVLGRNQVFREDTNSNNGTLTGTVTVSCVNGPTFSTGVGSQVSSTNLPSGLGLAVSYLNTTQCTLSVTGRMARPMSDMNMNNLNVTFAPAAFASGVASQIVFRSSDQMMIQMYDPPGTPALYYNRTNFNESSANDGTFPTDPNGQFEVLRIIASNVTFVGSSYNEKLQTNGRAAVYNVPLGLTGDVFWADNNEVRLQLLGKAVHNSSTDSISNVRLVFNNSAFVGTQATNVVWYDRNNISITYVDYTVPQIYELNNIYFMPEDASNNGSFTYIMHLMLSGTETYNGVSGEDFVTNGKVTISNVPAGLAASVKYYSSTEARLTLSGNAAKHTTADDINNMTVIFNNTAFSGGAASNVANRVLDYIEVHYLNPAGSKGLSYDTARFKESAANDGSIANPAVITLAGALFDGVSGEDMVTNGKVTVTNLPPGLTANALFSSSTRVVLSLLGQAPNHWAAKSITNLTVRFNDAAFSGVAATSVIASTRSNIAVTFTDGDQTQPQIIYGGTSFYENPANDGSVTNIYGLDVYASQFSGTNGEDFVANGKCVVSNLPAGLTAHVVLTDLGAHASFYISGNAVAHDYYDSVTNAGIYFQNGAFVGLTPDLVLRSSRSDITVKFDPWYTPPTILTSTTNIFIPEGGSTNFTVRLSSQPSGAVTVTVANVSGDADIQVNGTSSFVFTTANWSNSQAVTLTAAEDPDWAAGTAIVQCTAFRLSNVNITATELENDVNPANLLPFNETFETSPANMAGAPGAVDGQHGWVAPSANNVVTTANAHSGLQSLALGTGTVSHTFNNASGTVCVSYWAIPYMSAMNSAIPDDEAVVFWFGTNGQVLAYSNSTLVQVSGFNLQASVWTKFDVTCDYTAKVWSLSLNMTNVIRNFGFYSNQNAFSEFRLANSAGTAFLDDVNISILSALSSPFDDWLILHYGSTNVDVNALASNGVNTILGAYIAGLDPTNSTAVFALSGMGIQTSNRILSWLPATTGRLYSVYWSSNLLSGFGILTSNLTSGAFTDTVHGADASGFYQIKVQMAP